uniref:Spore protein YkvP/CgeB glycosyl transferase-like domain-containing protein n=1 Tax=Prevotella sp. GTC17253 TaxID=3236793 RepID=A0AB33IN20_9BACT
MNLIAITLVAPASENIQGTSALPYHLLKNRANDIDLILYTFNSNHLSDSKISEVEKELNCRIVVIPIPRWVNFLIYSSLGMVLRFILPYPLLNYLLLPHQILSEIKSSSIDGVFIYGEELSRVVRQLNGSARCIHVLPDCESLFYARLLKEKHLMDKITWIKARLMIRKFVRIEKTFIPTNTRYYLVGDIDAQRLQTLNKKLDVHFFRHPHYTVMNESRKINFHVGKIELLIAGQANLYMKYGVEAVCKALCNSTALNQFYRITFLGRGWNKYAHLLSQYGFDVRHINYADNYIEEICKYDIQLTPIVIGTGTKGKVLDAIANGLLVIGTPYALENIAAKDNNSCLEYHTMDELLHLLFEIACNRGYYEKIADRGRETVLQIHDAKKVFTEMFKWYHQG